MSDHRSEISSECYSNSIDTYGKDTYDEKITSLLANLNQLRIDDGLVIGFTCSAFDLFHAGHVIMLEDSKKQCDVLVVGIQADPTIDRPVDKNTPIQSYKDRNIMISSCKYVDELVSYTTENDLHNILTELKPNVRILGSDWKDKKYTGYEIMDIRIYWHNRSGHNRSTTQLRKDVYQAELKKIQS